MRLIRAAAIMGLLGAFACSSPTQPSNPTPAPTPQPSTSFSRSGEGSATFELPAGITRVRIVGTAKGNSCHNFLVFVGQFLAVNDVIGSCEVAIGMKTDAICNVKGPRIDIRPAQPDHNVAPFAWTIEETKGEPSHCLYL